MKKYINKIKLSIPFLITTMLLFPSTVFAKPKFKPGGGDSIVQYYIQNKEFLKQETLFSSYGRSILGAIMKLLAKIAQESENVYNSVFDMLTFPTDPSSGFSILKDEMTQKIIIASIFAISIMAIGIIVMFGDRKKLNPIKGILIALCVFSGGTTALTMANKVVEALKNHYIIDTDGLAQAAVWENTYDLAQFMYANSINGKKGGLGNLSEKAFTPVGTDIASAGSSDSDPISEKIRNKEAVNQKYSLEEIANIDPNAVLYPEHGISKTDENILSHKISKVPDSQIEEAEQAMNEDEAEAEKEKEDQDAPRGPHALSYTNPEPDEDGVPRYGKSANGNIYYINKLETGEEKDAGKLMHRLMNDGPYYVYYFKWIPMYVLLGSAIFVYLLLAYKTFRLIIEIIAGQVLVLFQAPQIHNQRKIVDLLCAIRDTYITICLTILYLRLYELLITFILRKYDGFTEVFFILFATFAVIDGPNITEKVTGVDAGLKNAWGLAAIARVGSKAVHTGERAAKGAVHGAQKANRGLGTAIDTFKPGKNDGKRRPRTAAGKLAAAATGGAVRGIRGASEKAKDGKEQADNKKKGLRQDMKDMSRANAKSPISQFDPLKQPPKDTKPGEISKAAHSLDKNVGQTRPEANNGFNPSENHGPGGAEGRREEQPKANNGRAPETPGKAAGGSSAGNNRLNEATGNSVKTPPKNPSKSKKS